MAFCEIEFAHRRRQAQIDDAASQDRRHERQLHAEGLVLRGDDRHVVGAPPVAPTAPEIRRPPGRRRCHRTMYEVRLGQAADEALGFQCGQRNVEAVPIAGETGQRDAKGRRIFTRDPVKSPQY